MKSTVYWSGLSYIILYNLAYDIEQAIECSSTNEGGEGRCGAKEIAKVIEKEEEREKKTGNIESIKDDNSKQNKMK